MLKNIYSTPLHGVETFLCKSIEGNQLPYRLRVVDKKVIIPENAVCLWTLNDQGENYATKLSIYALPNNVKILDVNCEGAGRFQLSDNDIEIDWKEAGTDSSHYFQTIAIALWLELKSVPCIHANALEYQGKTIALIGPSGMGKSTLSSYCLSKGFNWLTDDMLALHNIGSTFTESRNAGNCVVYPSWPKARIWLDSLSKVAKQDSDKLHKVHDKFDKREIELPETQPTTPRKLSAIYLLNRQGAKLNNTNEKFNGILIPTDNTCVYIENINPSTATMALLQNSMLGDAYRSLGLEQQRFQQLTQLVNTLPIKMITYKTSYDDIDSVYQVILADMMSS